MIIAVNSIGIPNIMAIARRISIIMLNVSTREPVVVVVAVPIIIPIVSVVFRNITIIPAPKRKQLSKIPLFHTIAYQ